MKNLTVVLLLVLGLFSVAHGKDGAFPHLAMGVWEAPSVPGTFFTIQASTPANGHQEIFVMLTDSHGRPVATGNVRRLVDSSSIVVPVIYKDGTKAFLKVEAFTVGGTRASLATLRLHVTVVAEANSAVLKDMVLTRLP